MRDLENTFMRMMVLAGHLEGGTITDDYSGLHFFYSDDKTVLLIGRNGKYHCVFPQVVFELPRLFPEFKRDAADNVVYLPAPELGVYFGLMEFMGLRLEEFIHLFTVAGQNTSRFGGKVTNIDYSKIDISHNIHEFLNIILDEAKKK